MSTHVAPNGTEGAAGQEFQLSRGRFVGRGRDIGMLLLEAIGFPALALLFWMLYRNTGHGLAFLLFLSAWIGLLVEGGRSLYNVLRPGQRRWVYGVNSRLYFKKLLRGESDPLWNAARAPADYDLTSCDEHWDLSWFTVSTGPESISLVGAKPGELSGEKHPTLQVVIYRTEFEDEQEFERLAQALKSKG